MHGIECAFTGLVAGKPEIAVVGCGRPGMAFFMAVGREWVRVTAFSEAEERFAASLRSGDHVYIEGRLWLETREKNGEPRSGLCVSAFRCERLRLIGRDRPMDGDRQAVPTLQPVDDVPQCDPPLLLPDCAHCPY